MNACTPNNDRDAPHRNIQLSVVIPVHNEEDNVPPLLEEVTTALDGFVTFEVIVVDDGSTDGTPKKLADLSRLYPFLRVIRHHECYGQSAALWTGVRSARGEWIATLDGDGQNDPADIRRIIEQRGGLDALKADTMLCGYRKNRRDTWSKRLGSRIANAVRAFLLDDDTPDTGCGLKIFHRETALRFPFFDHMHRFLPALMKREGGKVESVEVNHRPRKHGRSHYSNIKRLLEGIVDLMGVRWLMKRGKRVRLTEQELEPWNTKPPG